MAQYMLSVWHDDEYDIDFSSEEAQRRMAQVGGFNAALAEQGALVFAAGLQPRAASTVMRHQEGAVVMTDGPYAESKEHIGGFWVIEAADRTAAEEWARRGAAACECPVEVRPLQGE